MRCTVVSLIFVLSACASPDQRYQQNIAHEYLSPKIRKLPHEDIQEITRVISEATRQDIVAIWTGKNEVQAGDVNVTTAFPSGGATLYVVRKQRGIWRMIWSGKLSDSLVHLAFEAP